MVLDFLPVLFGGLSVGLALGLFGSGGSILTVPILIYMLSHPEKSAIAESMAIVGLIAVSGGAMSQRAGLVSWKNVLCFGVPGMLGTYLGALISSYMSGRMQLLIFSMVMLLASLAMFRKSKSECLENTSVAQHWFRVALQGALVGGISGIVGVGGGFLIVPALSTLVGLSIRETIGTSLIIIFLNSSVGFAKHSMLLADLGLKVDYITVALFGVFGIVGSLLGNRFGASLNQKILFKLFALFLIFCAVGILIKEVSSL